MFQLASKKAAKLRLALTGPSGGGKTWTSLAIGTAFGGDVALADSEHGSASKYADQFKFFQAPIEKPFHPHKYIEAIQEAERAGFRTVILDSITHAWNGTGGIIDIVNEIAAAQSARMSSPNKFLGWAEGDKLYQELINAILQSNIHVIATIRSKQEHVLEKNDQGKNVVKRLGLQPIQRKGFEFEFDLVMAMDTENNATVTKTRCRDLPMNLLIRKPGEDVAKILMGWLHGEEWIEALSEPAVAYAADVWKVEKRTAYTRIQSKVQDEALSSFLPKSEFKEFVSR